MRLLPLLALFVLFAGCIVLPVGKNITTPGNQTQPPVQPPYQPPSQPPQNDTPPPQQNNTPPPPPQQNNTPPPPANFLNSKEISYVSEAWTIYGTLYPSKNPNPTKAIILAHKLGSDRSEWPEDVIQRLHDEIPDALIIAIDMRGHGKSTNMGTYQNFDMAAYKDMKTDILSVRKHIDPNYPTMEQLYVIGSSMGSTAAILAAVQDKEIVKVAMISPGMKYQDVDIARAIEDYPQPILAVAAGNDAYSVQAVHVINSLATPTQLTSKVYIASGHGAALFEETKSDSEPLLELLVTFLKK